MSELQPPPALHRVTTMVEEALAEAKVIDRKIAEISERYELGDMLGEGRFSKVFSATRGRAHFALKEMDMATLEEDEEAVEALVQETTALRKAYAASSKHVPKLHEVVQVGEDTLYVVMDQVRGCELFEMLEGGSLSESSARRLIAQLLSALSGLHRHHVVHRDVKPENLMVSDIDDPSKCRLVVIDFGYAACEAPGPSADGEEQGLTMLAGSPEYAAPEVLAWLDGEGDPYTKACDMWSVGVTAYVLLVGELPYELPGEGDLERHVRETPPNFSQEVWSSSPEMAAAKDFVLACMRVEPSQRLTAQQALRHAWFAPRADDSQSVAIGASLAAFARLQRRVAGLSVTDAPRRVTRWLGRLTGKGAKGPKAVPKQMFWELKLGMPPQAEEQEDTAPLIDAAAAQKAAAAAYQASLDAQRSARGEAKSSRRPHGPPHLPLSPLKAMANAPAVPEALASAKKLVDRLDTDRQEEEAIKRSTPRGEGYTQSRLQLGGGSENPRGDPLPSPRRALFLAPSPRRQEQLRLDALERAAVSREMSSRLGGGLGGGASGGASGGAPSSSLPPLDAFSTPQGKAPGFQIFQTPTGGAPSAAPTPTGMPKPAAQTGMPKPAVQTGMPMPAVQTGMPKPAVQTGMPMPAIQTGMPNPAVQTGMPMPAVQTGMPTPALQTGMGMPLLQTPQPPPPDLVEMGA